MPTADKKPRVLCVDDQNENLKIRTMMLELFGCETYSAADHREAMRVLKRAQIDLMIIDYHLGNGENGEEVARSVRQTYPQIKLMMLTGDVKLPDSAKDSVDAFLIKGASDPRALLRSIEDLLRGAELGPRKPMRSDPPSEPKAS